MFSQWEDAMRLAFRPLEPFAYSPLPPNTIRLLTPCEPTNSSGYMWRLDTVHLDDPEVAFDALSYTWGSPAESYPITCNGKLLRVHYNLYTALPHLAQRRGHVTPLPIWIDAISINQGDAEEKRAQIPLMSFIYGSAQIVWAWLGIAQHQEQIPSAINMFPLIKVAGIEAKHHEKRFGTQKLSGLEGLDASLWSAVLHLTDNEWFRRVWVIQEAALARNLIFMCGDHQLTGQQIRGAISDMIALCSTTTSDGNCIYLGDAVIRSDAVFFVRDMVQRYVEASIDARSLLLEITSFIATTHGCSQPQDRVIGLLGLFDDEELMAAGVDSPPMYPDIPDLYTWFSKSLLTGITTDTPGWYSYLELALNDDPNRSALLPSWVPDLHHLSTPSVYLLSNRARRPSEALGPNVYQASSEMGKLVRKGSQPDVIIVRGRLLNEIVAAYPEIPAYPSDPGYNTTAFEQQVSEYLLALLDWEEKLSEMILGDSVEIISTASNRGANEDSISVASYWQMLHWDVEDAGPAEDAHQRYREFRSYLRRFLETAVWSTDEYACSTAQRPNLTNSSASANVNIADELSDAIESQLQIDVAAMMHLEGRQLFLTEQGYCGYTKRGVQPGDALCLITGLPVLHVLRKMNETGDGEQCWELVGDAYVQGLMHGEVDEMNVAEGDVVLV
jgi:hypothetical protein